MADLDVLINNFRLLEVAGAAEQIAHQSEGQPDAPLWRAYAQAARNYHSWISTGDFDNFGLLAMSDAGAAVSGKRKFFEDIISEVGLWTPELSFRGSYLHFLGSFEAMNNLDGERMIRELEAVVARLDPREERASLEGVRLYFAALDSPSPAGDVIISGHVFDEVITSYQAMQVVADELGPAFGLGEPRVRGYPAVCAAPRIRGVSHRATAFKRMTGRLNQVKSADPTEAIGPAAGSSKSDLVPG